MAFSTLPLSGIGFTQVDTAPGFVLGTQTFGSDGKLYVYAVAGADIAADTAVCDVDPDTFIVAATGGAYTSPSVEVPTGNYGWFAKASV